jgi:predicted nucleotidyltransferase
MEKKLLTRKESIALQKFKQKIQQTLNKNVIALKLFGSKARGESQKDSDIDVLIVLKKVTPEIKDQILDIAFEVNVEFDVYISPRVIAKEIFKHPIWKITPFIKTIQKEGIAI